MSKQIKIKDLVTEGRMIQEKFNRKLNEDEDTIIISKQANQAAKFFEKVWQSWYVYVRPNIKGVPGGETSDVVGDLTSTGRLIQNFHNGITDSLDTGTDTNTTIKDAAETIQYIVNTDGTSAGDFAGSVKVRQYLNAIPKFVNEMDKLIEKIDEPKSKKAFIDYKNNVQKFATFLRSVPKN